MIKHIQAYLHYAIKQLRLSISRINERSKKFYLLQNQLILTDRLAQLSGKPYTEEVLHGQKISFTSFEEINRLLTELDLENSYPFSTNKEQPFIIDCGANIGMAILSFKRSYPQSKIMGFEANPQTFQILKKNIEANDLTNVKLIEAAVSNKKGSIALFSDEGNQHSLVASTKRFSAENTKTHEVEAVLLSDYIQEPVDLLKIDIEGAEGDVIEDLSQSGKLDLINQLFIEYHHHIDPEQDQLADFLKIFEDHGFGYQLKSIGAPKLEHKSFQDLMIYCYKK